MKKLGWVLVIGWLLMTPPFEGYMPSSDFKWLDGAPVGQWVHDSSYDTAGECESAKQMKSKEAIVMGRAFPEEEKDLRLRLLERYIKSRCIPSDYLYPPKN
jgi:hypothetical protein